MGGKPIDGRSVKVFVEKIVSLEDRNKMLAMRVVNLRGCLSSANACLIADGKFGLACDETGSPTFPGGRRFWERVRKLSDGNE